jgi:type I restriction enzyme M protein
MLTGEIRSQIDQIWNAFWSGGISNPLKVIEQITYLLFLKRLIGPIGGRSPSQTFGGSMANASFPYPTCHLATVPNGKPDLSDNFRIARHSLVTRQSGQRDCNYLTLTRYIE